MLTWFEIRREQIPVSKLTQPVARLGQINVSVKWEKSHTTVLITLTVLVFNIL